MPAFRKLEKKVFTFNGMPAPVLQQLEEKVIGEDGLQTNSLDLASFCEGGCGRSIRTKEEAAGFCFLGHVSCAACSTACSACGLLVCGVHRAVVHERVLCPSCAQHVQRISVIAAVLALLALGFGGWLLYTLLVR
jgi:hypothetical protein